MLRPKSGPRETVTVRLTARVQAQVYLLHDLVEFTGHAKKAREEIKSGEYYEAVPAERSTHSSTIAYGLRQSRRTINEATAMLAAPAWRDWARKDREFRNAHAGKPHIAT